MKNTDLKEIIAQGHADLEAGRYTTISSPEDAQALAQKIKAVGRALEAGEANSISERSPDDIINAVIKKRRVNSSL